MTQDQFDDFIDEHMLYSFDGKILIRLNDGTSHEGIWITNTPQLGESVDGKYKGVTEHPIFYFFDSLSFAVIGFERIDELTCLEKNYLT